MKLTKYLPIYFVMQLSMASWLHAGYITLTTTDSAPTYSYSNNPPSSEVVVGTSTGQGAPTTLVTLTTTCSNGTIAVTYTQSNGITKMSGSDMGSGTKLQTTVFSLGSGTVGKVNTITATVVQSGATETGTDIPCPVNFKSKYDGPPKHNASHNIITFTICVPKVSAPKANTATNTFTQFSFRVQPTIVGCDDFSQIQWTQQIVGSTTIQDFSGNNYPVTLPYYADTGGTYTNDQNMDWQSPSTTGAVTFTISGTTAAMLNPSDLHQYVVPDIDQKSVVINSVTYQYAALIPIASYSFKDEIRRAADSASLGEFDWGSTWDNNNQSWSNRTNTNDPPTYSQYESATLNTSGAYGGTLGTTTGEFSNLNNISLP